MTGRRRDLARQFMNGDIDAPASLGTARLMPAIVKSGAAASLNRGITHLVAFAALAVDNDGAALATRWECSGGSVNAVPVTDEDNYAICANCRDVARHPRGPVVYRCYDADDELIYIGSSINLRQRIYTHRSSTRWWGEVARVEAEPHPSEGACRIAEGRAIATESPYYNTVGVPPEVNASP